MCDHAPNREAAMVRISEKVWCDPCLAPLVKALNGAGMPTVASCCGHGHRPSTVALADGREVIVARTFEEARAITSGFPDINASGRFDDGGKFPTEPYPAHPSWFARLRARIFGRSKSDVSGRHSRGVS